MFVPSYCNDFYFSRSFFVSWIIKCILLKGLAVAMFESLVVEFQEGI